MLLAGMISVLLPRIAVGEIYQPSLCPSFFTLLLLYSWLDYAHFTD